MTQRIPENFSVQWRLVSIMANTMPPRDPNDDHDDDDEDDEDNDTEPDDEPAQRTETAFAPPRGFYFPGVPVEASQPPILPSYRSRTACSDLRLVHRGL